MECGVSPEGAPSPLWIAFPRLPGWDRGPFVFNPKRCRRPDESGLCPRTPKAIAFFRTDSVFSSLQPVVYPAGKHATAVRRACFLTGGMVPGVAEGGAVLAGCIGSMFYSLGTAGGWLRLGGHPHPALRADLSLKGEGF